jgi:membrane-associated PAP2 superfamily phosphatase
MNKIKRTTDQNKRRRGWLRLLVLFLGFQERWRRLAAITITIGLVYGILIGLGRIVQGGHYLTDVLWSFGIVALVAVTLNDILLARLFRKSPAQLLRCQY